MKCDICIREAKPHSISCARCYSIVNATKFHRRPRRLSLIASYDPPTDQFICRLTHIPMADDDPQSPFYVHSVQRLPGNQLDRMAVCAFVSMLKSDLADWELLKVVPHLDDHFRKGTPFKKDIIPFRYWRRKAPAPPKAAIYRGMPIPPSAKKCFVCIRPAIPNSKYCPRCRKIIFPKPNWKACAEGLKAFYDPDADGFRDAYLGYLLDTDDLFSPHYTVLDHVNPGEEKVVPCAFWLNDMKGRLRADTFKRVIAEFANHLRTGEPFDKNVIPIEDWKKNLIRMRLAGKNIA
jgi:hypothetical protein